MSFEVEEDFYEQVDGSAMSSPLSPVIANICMEESKEGTLDTLAA